MVHCSVSPRRTRLARHCVAVRTKPFKLSFFCNSTEDSVAFSLISLQPFPEIWLVSSSQAAGFLAEGFISQLHHIRFPNMLHLSVFTSHLHQSSAKWRICHRRTKSGVVVVDKLCTSPTLSWATSEDSGMKNGLCRKKVCFASRYIEGLQSST